TNNVAEYEALRQGLLCAIRQGWKKVHAFSDSELLVKQMLGQYKIKNEALRKLAPVVQRLIRQLDAFTIAYIGRAHNRLADKLAALALKGTSER
ncbi:reverse transcriptase-like protein, partial [Candidatus Sumerlaeota bacterium]|nr:reverse transcriptase-like protein [Candidatus Sumerlaeota bacterium]